MMTRKPTTNNQTEWWVKEQVKKILEDTGWKFWMPAAGAFGRSGVSDFLAIKQPRLFMAIETKYDDEVTVLQFEFLNTIHAAGHCAFLVDETNIDDLKYQLSGEGVFVRESLLKWKNQNPIKDIRINKA
jgi:hypothetical protein